MKAEEYANELCRGSAEAMKMLGEQLDLAIHVAQSVRAQLTRYEEIMRGESREV